MQKHRPKLSLGQKPSQKSGQWSAGSFREFTEPVYPAKRARRTQ
jgi:hypothetical protein